MVQLTHPFSVSAIYSDVLNHLRALDPSQITPDGFRIANALDYANALPGLQRREFRRTPVHFVRENRYHRHHMTIDVVSSPCPSSPSSPPRKRDSSSHASEEKGGGGPHVKVPPGFDIVRTTQDVERMALLSDEMVRIARAAERDSASMHVISLLTMVFLPATFVSVLLSTTNFEDPNLKLIDRVVGVTFWKMDFPLGRYFWSNFVWTTLLTLLTFLSWWHGSGVLYRRRLWQRGRAEDHVFKMS
ncbi:hypothetical protein B0T18DRAFT_168598 [Schizothecium vesticola]|uniref:Uncharacterized protein n=1 Tax=Schizothecium vesticola TaxID=314040 RepID=A0AA40ENQ4_9PEZI|nr:hypothetical protein B0T18DRAFT_168598 [Schizothecium vesticola]